MKKDIPNLLKLEIPYDVSFFEELHLMRYNIIIDEGYSFSYRDFDLLCAILIRKYGIDNAPNFIKNYAFDNGQIVDKIKFEMLHLAASLNETLNVEDEEFHIEWLFKRALDRKNIVRKEIGRVVNNAKNITFNNSQYYRELIKIVAGFTDTTFMDWFVPIKLTFEKFVHIYVKHVEETKFGEGQFKKRSFFDYKHTEIFSLIKVVIKQECEDIKRHFVFVSAGIEANRSEFVKDYHRGWGKFPKLIYDGNEFRLTIDKNGFLQTFYQNK